MSVMTLSKHTPDLSRKPRHALLINGHKVEFEVDTGSPIALIGENVWKNIGSPRLARSRIKLSAYGQQQISVTGECTVDVKCGSTVLPLPLVVVSSGASLLGLNWIQAFQLDINALLYTPKVSAEPPSADVHTVGMTTAVIDASTTKRTGTQPHVTTAVTDASTPKHTGTQPDVTAPAANLSPWPIPDNPWDRVHVNFAGPFLGSMWLLAMDAHSKWPSVIRLANYPTTEITIAGLDALFTIWGLPKTLVSDNGPQFASADFANWCRSNGIVHMTSAPFHPSSNGEVERLVGVFKRAMQRSVVKEGLEKDQAARAFLREYRSTPHSTTGRTPAELMLGRQFRTRLSLLQPVLPHVEKKQQLAKPVRPTKFSNGDHVFIRNYGVNRRVKWVPGRVTSSVGTRMFNVQCADGPLRRGPSSSCRSDAPEGQSLAHVFAATSRRVPFSGSYAIGYTNTGFTKMRDADKGRPTRCSQCRITSSSPQHTRSPCAEHVLPLTRNCGEEMLCFRFDFILLRTFCRV